MTNKLGLWLLASVMMLMTGCSSTSTKEEVPGREEEKTEEVSDFYLGAGV